MKKVLLLVVAMATFAFSSAQTDKGNIFFEANTGFGAAAKSNTGFYLNSTKVGTETVTSYNIGAEAGYFVMDNLAVKLGLGYGGSSSDFSRSIFSYKIGAKYYVIGKIPFQVDLNGASIEDADENPMYVGIQGGYAFFIGENVSIEPGIRYDISMNDKFTEEGNLQFNIGFVFHL